MTAPLWMTMQVLHENGFSSKLTQCEALNSIKTSNSFPTPALTLGGMLDNRVTVLVKQKKLDLENQAGDPFTKREKEQRVVLVLIASTMVPTCWPSFNKSCIFLLLVLNFLLMLGCYIVSLQRPNLSKGAHGSFDKEIKVNGGF